ncbi:flagellin [Termitidicoccus mucosus]|uniref:Flagellin n=1 Tax=Termitidicoccus mucosus TaxID=1184151 RepID=A0A178IGC7_9BACT|nr:hypothetical protein AW736_16440 [Opitutaceae bacterium TSB47]
MAVISFPRSGSGNLAARLGTTQSAHSEALMRLSSGNRMLTPSDDVAGTGTSAKLTSQQARLEAAGVNIQNGISRLESTSGYLTAISSILTRMSELSAYAKNGTQEQSDASLYTQEFQQLQEQLRSMIGGTAAEIGGAGVDNPMGTFGGADLFGPDGGGLVAIGAYDDEVVLFPTINLRSGATKGLIEQDASGNFIMSLSDDTAISDLNAAIDQIGMAFSEVGAVQSRLELAAGKLTANRELLETKQSRIEDADVAEQMTTLVRLGFLSQSQVTMLTQAIETPRKLVVLLADS